MTMTPIIASLFAASATAGASPFAAVEPIAEAELATLRGGFTLPNGIDVSMVVQSQTAVDGAVVLQSVFQFDQGPPTLQVYSGGSSQSAAVAPPDAAAGGVSVQFSPQTGLSIVQQPGLPGGVSVTTGAAAQSPVTGATPLALSADGTPVATANGLVSLRNLANGSRVVLEAPDLSVQHLFGNGFGSVIANSGDNRVIDTFTTISLSLDNVSPYVMGSTLFRVEGIALDATRMLIGR